MTDLQTDYQLPKYNDMTKENQTSDKHQCHTPLAGVSARFCRFVSEYQPGDVSRMVLESLIRKYKNGNIDALFGKLLQLEKSELYTLTVIFRDCFIYLGIDEQYKSWRIQNVR